MPVVFVHGVAVREPDDPQFSTVSRVMGEIDWQATAQTIRGHLAPTLAPLDPDGVPLEFVYWGDLGAPHGEREAMVDRAGPPAADDGSADGDEVTEQAEAALLRALPHAAWPDAVRILWRTARLGDAADDDGTPDASTLVGMVRASLAQERRQVPRWQQNVAANLQSGPRVQVAKAMDLVRSPSSDFVQVFLGDMLRYVAGRGTAAHPGAITRRVIDALDRAHDAAVSRREPIVVVTHSMGGQLVYDALTACSGGRDWSVDLWCSVGGQLGLFKRLGVFLEETDDPGDGAGSAPAALTDRVGHLWNVWSSSDVLSFPARPDIPMAHDTDMAYLRSLAASHLAYLDDEDLWRTLAAKVEVHT